MMAKVETASNFKFRLKANSEELPVEIQGTFWRLWNQDLVTLCPVFTPCLKFKASKSRIQHNLTTLIPYWIQVQYFKIRSTAGRRGNGTSGLGLICQMDKSLAILLEQEEVRCQEPIHHKLLGKLDGLAGLLNMGGGAADIQCRSYENRPCII